MPMPTTELTKQEYYAFELLKLFIAQGMTYESTLNLSIAIAKDFCDRINKETSNESHKMVENEKG
jgi:hypothetical protein